MNPCTVPSPKPDSRGDNRWMKTHQYYKSKVLSSKPDVVLIGDSIIKNMTATPLWKEKFARLKSLNLGIGGDRVEHVLWRLSNGMLQFKNKVKVVVLFVGTNNVSDKAEHVYEGILKCICLIKKKLGSDVHVVLPTLLPRGQYPNCLRNKNNHVNELLVKYSKDLENVHVVVIHENLIDDDGTISKDTMHDYLHLTDSGYDKTFLLVYEKVASLLKQDFRTAAPRPTLT